MGLFELILSVCKEADKYHSNRSLYSVNSALTSEVGEIAEEVAIAMGDSYKAEGPDGIKGEAIDAINSCMDLLYVCDRSITEEELVAIARPKLEKWLEKIKQANAEGKIK